MALANMQLISDIANEKERAQFTLHSIGDAVITTNSHGHIEYMNHIAEHLTGWMLPGVKNTSIKNVFRIFDQDTREPMINLVDTCLTDGVSISKSTITLINKDGIEREIECSMSPILGTDNTTEGIVLVFHDETERYRMEHNIKHQSTHDSLTGLINRDEFNRQLTEHVYDSKNLNKEHSLGLINLDQFKLIIDACGHEAGDELLKQITVLLGRCTRNGDLIGRIGRDEFGIILDSCSADNAIHIAEKITDEINSLKFIWDENQYVVYASIGLAQITADTSSTDEIMAQADVACNAAKDYGNNRVYLYQHKDRKPIRKTEDQWEPRILQAIEKQQFKLYAQPIVPLNKNSSKHLEVLIRLEDDDGHLIAPNVFIPAAERYHLMSDIDMLVIKNTFEFIRESNATDLSDMIFTINLSGDSLNNADFINHVKELISEYGIDAETICFEITETVAIINLQKTKTLIKELKIIGCQFSLDNFGSGLSSFDYLKDLPVNFIKIDGNFVRDMIENKIDHAMVAAINQIGHVMGITTIAKFVETDDIVQQLTKLDVDFAQGYFISRPIELSEAFSHDIFKKSLSDSA